MTDKHKPRHRIFYKSIPKVELHRHLEGSLRLTTMLEIARDFKLDLPYNNVDKFRSLVQMVEGEPFTHKNFLLKFNTLRQLYRSPEAIKKIAKHAIMDAASDNIRYMELRFTPVALTRVRDYPLGEAMDWVIDTVEETSKEYGVMTTLIANVNRHESLELAEEVLKLSIDRLDKGIAAFDIGGNEADFPGEKFAGIFQEAKQAGLRITVHAGEWGGPENITLAVDKLGAERIGHGVRIMEDPKVVDMALERKITFEVCPTSNYQTGSFPTIGEHPLPDMHKAGLDVTVNTDDPSMFQIDLSDEYELTCETLGLGLDALQGTVLNAAKAAFLPEEKKKELIDSLKEEFEENDKEINGK